MITTMAPFSRREMQRSFPDQTSNLNKHIQHEILGSACNSHQNTYYGETRHQLAADCQEYKASREELTSKSQVAETVVTAESLTSVGQISETVDGDDGNINSYNKEAKRLESFANWPAHSKIDYKKLAKAGFFYLNEGDEVVCFSCKGRLGGWQPGNQQVMKKHRELFPQCDFVNNKSNNVPLLKSYNSMENGSNTNHMQSGSVENMRTELEAVQTHSSHVQNGSVGNMRTESAVRGDQTACKQVESISDTDKRFEKLQNMEERLKTYTSWPVTFLSPEEMAAAGFFYCGTEDKVQCAYCRGGIFNWQEGNDPVEQHLKEFPRCPFFSKKLYKGPSKGRDVCGIYKNQEVLQLHQQLPGGLHNPGQLEELGINLHRGPKHPEQATEIARLRSFQSWPSYIPVQKELLAKAGFFYIGISDHTKCFYCGGGLRSWEPKDDPWVEHSRWFPNCAYLQLTKGQDFIESCQQKGSAETTNSNSYSSSSSLNCSNAKEEQTVNDDVEKIMNSSMIQAVIESGPFPHFLVRAAVIKHEREKGREFLNIDELSDTIATIRDEEMYASSSSNSENEVESSDDQLMTDDTPLTSGGSSSENGALAGNLASNATDMQSAELPLSQSVNTEKSKGITIGNNGKVRDMCLCKICMDNEVGIVFLPCGHLLACPSCATAISDCPVCKTPIRGTVRTYLS